MNEKKSKKEKLKEFWSENGKLITGYTAGVIVAGISMRIVYGKNLSKAVGNKGLNNDLCAVFNRAGKQKGFLDLVSVVDDSGNPITKGAGAVSKGMTNIPDYIVKMAENVDKITDIMVIRKE